MQISILIKTSKVKFDKGLSQKKVNDKLKLNYPNFFNTYSYESNNHIVDFC